MNPTPEQLRDPAWWREHEPEGATHYDTNDIPACAWMRWDASLGWMGWIPDECKWAECKTLVIHPSWALVKRPPEPTPWRGMQDGLPPEGTRCQIINHVGGIICSDATITYQGAGVGCYVNNDNGMEYTVSHRDYSFWAIPSERDESADELTQVMVDYYDWPDGIAQYRNLAFYIHDAGYRKQISREEAYDRAIKSVGVTTANEKAVSLILDALGYKE